MFCTCCSQENINNLDNTFSAKSAKKEARRYLKKGLDKRARKLIAHLREHCTEPMSVLDVGGGAGAVHHELLRRGIASEAVSVDASSGYVAAAEANARELGLSERVKYFHRDFAQSAEEFEPADVVIMDRVICCYPYLEQLLGAAAERAQRYLTLSFPREDWWVRIPWRIGDTFFTLFRSKYHPYLHPHSQIRAVAEKAGLHAVHSDRYTIWQIMVFARS